MSQVADDVYGSLPPEYDLNIAEELGFSDVGILDYVISIVICLGALVIAAMTSDQIFHWFVVPCFLCGVMMGADFIAGLRGRLDIFDPKAFIGLVGLHFFYIASLILVSTDMQMLKVVNPEDWRPWVGIMGFLNVIGLVLYRIGSKLGERGEGRPRTVWVPNQYAFPIFTLFLFVAMALQLLVFVKFGGLSGLLSVRDEDTTALVGWTIPRLIGGSVALLSFMLLILLRLRKKRSQGSNFGIMITLGILLAFQFVVAGYSHSRGNIVFPVFWILGLIHYFWRPIKVKFFILMLVVSFPLMVFFSFYKSLGTDAMSLWKAYGSVDVLMHKSKRTPAGVLIGDFARTDVHALLVYKQITDPEGYDLRWGKTYYMCWTQVVPRELWRNRPPTGEKVLAGTEQMYGRGYFKPYDKKRKTTRAFGLSGEAVLNFGIWSAPIPFFIWGLWIGRLRRYLNNRIPGDLRLMIVPYFLWMAVNVLFWDVDNHLAHTLIRALIPMVAMFLSITKIPYEQYEQQLEAAEA